MEEIEMLKLCQRNHITVKRAFSAYGVLHMKDKRKPFKELTEQEVFAYLMNWIVHQLKPPKQVTIRHRVEQTTFEMKFWHNQRHLRVNKPKVISTDEHFIPYDWAEDDNLVRMNEGRISASIQRADDKNIQANQRAVEQAETSEPCLNRSDFDQLMADILANEHA